MAAIKIKYVRLSDGLEAPAIIDKGEWIDLRLSEDVHLSQGQFCMLPLGIRIKLPEEFEAYVVPRSSTFKNYGILQVNSPGVIDSSYCGASDEWKMPVYATSATAIKKNTRICQFRIVPSQKASSETKIKWLNANGIRLIEEEWLDGSEKSRGGFGSTGD